jgi:hypothetical protein
MRGQCLCGQVAFEISGALPNIYQCHCSLCRKATGSSSNAAFFVSAKNFHWLSGASNISTFIKPTGYNASFCSTCGSPAPIHIEPITSYWVPAGLLDEPTNLKVAAHLHTGSKAAWDEIPHVCALHTDGVTLEELLRLTMQPDT